MCVFKVKVDSAVVLPFPVFPQWQLVACYFGRNTPYFPVAPGLIDSSLLIQN